MPISRVENTFKIKFSKHILISVIWVGKPIKNPYYVSIKATIDVKISFSYPFSGNEWKVWLNVSSQNVGSHCRNVQIPIWMQNISAVRKGTDKAKLIRIFKIFRTFYTNWKIIVQIIAVNSKFCGFRQLRANVMWNCECFKLVQFHNSNVLKIILKYTIVEPELSS